MSESTERTEPDSPLHSRIADALARLSALARRTEQHASMAQELSPLQARALVTLRNRGDLRVGEIARELLVTYGTVSVAISSLEEKGLIHKFADPEEHRAVRVELTRRGQALANRAADWNSEVLAPAIAALRPEEASAFLAALLKILLGLERDGTIHEARMCLSCKYFVPNGGDGSRPHFCGLLEAPIGVAQLRTDCPDHQRAAARQLGATARAFRTLD